ncbi:MAG: chromate transporter [Evtepia sp.]|uniref:chromate transporter n=1 Tax=Evtepia sp. TaxID=2773933 RepID=UPI002A75F736|nr:chromate transporter [Evtepia sp.]MDY3015002.1 chromate transporter [Evtepia sp.]
MILLRLYWEFLLVGLFSMGGGMATVPFLFDLSARTGWFSTGDLTSMIAISEATPGPIGINMATYVGYVTAGLPGSIVAPLGLVTPAVIIILLISRLLNSLWKDPRVAGLFYGLRPASVGLIAAAAFSICAVSLFSWNSGALSLHWPSILLFVGMLVAMNLPKLKNLPSVTFIAVAAVIGIVFQMVD